MYVCPSFWTNSTYMYYCFRFLKFPWFECVLHYADQENLIKPDGLTTTSSVQTDKQAICKLWVALWTYIIYLNHVNMCMVLWCSTAQQYAYIDQPWKSNLTLIWLSSLVTRSSLKDNLTTIHQLCYKATYAVQSKTQYAQYIKHNRYFHSTSNFRSIHSHGKRLYVHMFDMVDITFSHEEHWSSANFFKNHLR